MSKHIAIYIRVSTKSQDHRSQLPDLENWAANQEQPVKWYKDKASGKSFDRPQWKSLEEAMQNNQVSQVVIWRLDRLGRSVSGLSNLFEEFRRRKINLVSLKDGIDLSTSAGRLMANVIASVAQYETELRGERVLAGQQVARKKGKRWGGSQPGVRKKVTATQEKMIVTMKADGEPIARIAKALKLSRPTIYDVLKEAEQKSHKTTV